MKIRILSLLLAFGCIMPSAFAATDKAPEMPSTIVRILSAEAQPGDQARSRNNPNISYRVLGNGTIEMTNAQTGARKYFKLQTAQNVNSRGSEW
jgi:hypothetical protein